MRNYAAITIGPIIETISSVSKPGALWCASGMFSYITAYLCKQINAELDDAKIVSPAYSEEYDMNDGIGKWHDRIIFSCALQTDELKEKLKMICQDAKKHLAIKICEAIKEPDATEDAEKYIDKYIQLNWLVTSEKTAHAGGKNCILNLSPYLDSVELTADFPSEETNSPLTKLLNGKREDSNCYIKNCWLVPDNKQFQLLDKAGKIRDIEHIANPSSINDALKYRSYYAIIQSDGDGIGKCLESCVDDEDVSSFSEVCVKYTKSAAALIGAYGGLTVYAGGDDLLFLAPLRSDNGENIFTLCKKITDDFNSKFRVFSEKMAEKGNVCSIPTLSFGVSVNFYKAPLYEAVKEVLGLLFGVAKADKKDKNKIAISLHKHSGQSVKLVLPNCWDKDAPLKKLEEIIDRKYSDNGEQVDELLKSVLYKLSLFEKSYELCREVGVDIQDLFDNLFDSTAHDKNRSYINTVKALCDTVRDNGKCLACDNNATEKKEKLVSKELAVVNAMLRLAKIYYERGKE